MGRLLYVREMQLMLMSTANITVQTNIWEPDHTVPRSSGSTLFATKLVWNKLAEHKWRFTGLPMMAQHCWLSSVVIFQGILTSIAKKPYISYEFSGGGGVSRAPVLPLDLRMNMPN